VWHSDTALELGASLLESDTGKGGLEVILSAGLLLEVIAGACSGAGSADFWGTTPPDIFELLDDMLIGLSPVGGA
jgi:hypothetical protein